MTMQTPPQEAGSIVLNTDWSAAMARIFGDLMQKNNPYGRFVQGKSGLWNDLYKAQDAQNAIDQKPQVDFMTFLQGMDPASEWSAMAPSQRGESGSPLIKYLTMFGQR